MKITKESLKFPQIDFSLRYIVENNFVYRYGGFCRFVRKPLGIIEFGTGSGRSLQKIVDYVKDNDLDVYIMGYDGGNGLPAEKVGIPVFEKYGKGTYRYDFKETIRKFIPNKNVFLRECLFENIPKGDADFINAAILIHCDADLYLSTKQALEWCFDNHLVIKHSIICFDEYTSIKNGGEKRAFEEAEDKYGFEAKEIFHYIYRDKDTNQEIRQNCFEITRV